MLKGFFSAVFKGIKKGLFAVGRFLKKLAKEQKALFIAMCGAVLFIVLCILKTNQSICEFWTRTVSRAIVVAVGAITSLLPFSVYELCLIAVIIYFIVLAVVLIVRLIKKKGKTMLPILAWTLAVAMLFLDFYTASASFAYNREELPLGGYSVSESGALTLEEYTEFCELLTDEMNRLALSMQRDNGKLVNPYSRQELNEMISEDMKCLSEFDGYFTDWTGTYKQPVLSIAMAEMGILGVFFAPVGEANVSAYTHPLDIPTTIAHELAHSKGVMRENQANLVAYYVALRSQNDYIRYSAMQSVYYTCLSGLFLYDGGGDVYRSFLDDGKLCKEANDDRKDMYEHYKQFTLLRDISTFFNDLYLKLQGQSEGTGSYNDEQPDMSIIKPENPGEKETIIIHKYSDIQSLVLNWCRENESNA